VISIQTSFPCQNEWKPVQHSQEDACKNRVITSEPIEKGFHPHESKSHYLCCYEFKCTACSSQMRNLSWETRIQFVRANWSIKSLWNDCHKHDCPWRIKWQPQLRLDLIAMPSRNHWPSWFEDIHFPFGRIMSKSRLYACCSDCSPFFTK